MIGEKSTKGSSNTSPRFLFIIFKIMWYLTRIQRRYVVQLIVISVYHREQSPVLSVEYLAPGCLFQVTSFLSRKERVMLGKKSTVCYTKGIFFFLLEMFVRQSLTRFERNVLFFSRGKVCMPLIRKKIKICKKRSKKRKNMQFFRVFELLMYFFSQIECVFTPGKDHTSLTHSISWSRKTKPRKKIQF